MPGTMVKGINSANILLFAAVLVAGIILSFFPPVKFLINYFVDDGCFYLKIANNFATGHGSTFDGINSTNGYHPLWFLILSLWFFLVSLLFSNPSPELLMKFSCLLHYGLLCLTVFFTYKAYRILFTAGPVHKWLFFCALILVPLATRNFGVEVHLVPVLLAAYLWLKAMEFRLNIFYPAWKIILFVLIGLTRIENFFTVVPVMICYEVVTSKHASYIKSALMYIIPSLAVLLLYLLTNYIFFGHFFTVSSTIKSSFPNFYFLENIEALRANAAGELFITSNLMFFILSASLIIIRIFRETSKRSDTRLSVFLLYLSIAYVLYLALNLAFNKECFREWYLSGIVYISAITLSTIIQTGKKRVVALAILASCFFLFYFYNGRIQSSRNLPGYEFAKDIQRLVTPDETVFQIDYSGFTGFFSDRKIVNGDGLVNSFEFYDCMKKNTLPDYLIRNKIDYYITFYAVTDSVHGSINDVIYGKYFGKLMVFPLHQIVFSKRIPSESFLSSRDLEYYLIKF